MQQLVLLDRRLSSWRTVSALATLAFVLCAALVRANRPWQPAAPAAAPADPADLVSLVDQEREPFFLREWRGRTLVVSFIFTHCQTSCPLQVQALSVVQRALPRALSRRVQFVSFSIDPARDTPEVLAQYAEAMGMRLDNWSFVTGHPQEISWLHRHYGTQVKRIDGDQLDHRVAVYLLDAKGELAQKYTGDLDPSRLAKEIADVDSLYNEAPEERAEVR